ncbi:unnamed protein product [Trichogramma brassicae]|uniref:Uncharacterized protein n=1 Tax=Trichogramma brassicae TaxID=86971 RepID=A0A6H5I5P1_9HYME|nr:unnamed protein product [Trichogramma brassicae]
MQVISKNYFYRNGADPNSADDKGRTDRFTYLIQSTHSYILTDQYLRVADEIGRKVHVDDQDKSAASPAATRSWRSFSPRARHPTNVYHATRGRLAAALGSEAEGTRRWRGCCWREARGRPRTWPTRGAGLLCHRVSATIWNWRRWLFEQRSASRGDRCPRRFGQHGVALGSGARQSRGGRAAAETRRRSDPGQQQERNPTASAGVGEVGSSRSAEARRSSSTSRTSRATRRCIWPRAKRRTRQIELLLRHGADPNLANRRGLTCLDVCLRHDSSHDRCAIKTFLGICDEVGRRVRIDRASLGWAVTKFFAGRRDLDLLLDHGGGADLCVPRLRFPPARRSSTTDIDSKLTAGVGPVDLRRGPREKRIPDAARRRPGDRYVVRRVGILRGRDVDLAELLRRPDKKFARAARLTHMKTGRRGVIRCGPDAGQKRRRDCSPARDYHELGRAERSEKILEAAPLVTAGSATKYLCRLMSRRFLRRGARLCTTDAARICAKRSRGIISQGRRLAAYGILFSRALDAGQQARRCSQFWNQCRRRTPPRGGKQRRSRGTTDPHRRDPAADPARPAKIRPLPSPSWPDRSAPGATTSSQIPKNVLMAQRSWLESCPQTDVHAQVKPLLLPNSDRRAVSEQQLDLPRGLFAAARCTGGRVPLLSLDVELDLLASADLEEQPANSAVGFCLRYQVQRAPYRSCCWPGSDRAASQQQQLGHLSIVAHRAKRNAVLAQIVAGIDLHATPSVLDRASPPVSRSLQAPVSRGVRPLLFATFGSAPLASSSLATSFVVLTPQEPSAAASRPARRVKTLGRVPGPRRETSSTISSQPCYAGYVKCEYSSPRPT